MKIAIFFFFPLLSSASVVDRVLAMNKNPIGKRQAGSKADEVLSGVGRNGEDGTIHKRIYSDGNGSRWIYKNWDAHPTFQSTENTELNISCTP